ncbi:molybdopterin-dependent oxidoreductase [Paeniglutamicibacter cryotolerans]|uniref:DMSO/TMAO reductase YedYZ molybdopterin-dependent catalytic subunit n=1 Tax=Paeniglutamicibacter cryotolerans TaxID=670079 RepID=A0A839QM01_9MICC|nr:molybdopterin-dependent oxidoreductase [Paeniglutamicibacter cryotolerans]MBB2995784.1 DMSO/TMAO reductase YedYZ molybdopterin-dependent catalytic subunit [Paeniglutamicibacter cryotolerans]
MKQQRKTRGRDLARFGFLGLVSAAVLFAVAQLVSAFFAVSSAPLVAMGSVFINLTPPWLKDLVIGLFGTNDKLVLFLSLGLVAAIVAVGIGLLARRSFGWAAGCIVILGAVISVAVISRPATSLADITPTLVGVVASLFVMRALVNAAWRVEKAAVGEGPGADVERTASRRIFLFGTLFTVVGAGVVAGIGQSLATVRNVAVAAREALKLPAPRTSAPALPAGVQVDVAGMPPFVTPNDDFYRIDTALSVPDINPSDWSLRIHGMVEKELTIGFDELLASELSEAYVTLTCVSNAVGGSLVGNAKWLGLPIRDLLARAMPQPGADMVLSTSIDGFSASTPLEVLTDGRDALLAVGMNGTPLPLEHGFPVRMVVPGLYGFVSATKWVVDLEVTRFADAKAYWSTRGWSDHGPIKLASRVDVPRAFAKVASGKVTMGGTAWAQTRGISKVQVQIDDGDWKDATLGTEASVDTWRQWSYVWEGGSSGNHSVTVRAVDGKGKVQTSDKADPAPNGASGWQRIQFSVA